jgi:prepilin-type N-terminal cleavage/methylation domain-containing protein
MNNRRAFTLTEMVVVMLIMSIIFVAFAPIMTRRKKSESSAGNTLILGKLKEQEQRIARLEKENNDLKTIVLALKLQFSKGRTIEIDPSVPHAFVGDNAQLTNEQQRMMEEVIRQAREQLKTFSEDNKRYTYQ